MEITCYSVASVLPSRYHRLAVSLSIHAWTASPLERWSPDRLRPGVYFVLKWAVVTLHLQWYKQVLFLHSPASSVEVFWGCHETLMNPTPKKAPVPQHGAPSSSPGVGWTRGPIVENCVLCWWLSSEFFQEGSAMPFGPSLRILLVIHRWSMEIKH